MAQTTTPSAGIVRTSRTREIALAAGILAASVVVTLVTGLFSTVHIIITSSAALQENGSPFPWWQGTHYFSNITTSWIWGFFFLDVLFYDTLALLFVFPYQRKRQGLPRIRSDLLMAYALYEILGAVVLAAAVGICQIYVIPH